MYEHPKTGILYSDFYDAFGRRMRFSLKTRDYRLAKKKEAELITREATIKSSSEEIRLWEDFKYWYSSYLDNNKKPGTKSIWLLAVRYMEEFKTPVFLRDITPEYLLDFKSWLQGYAKQNGGKPGPAGRNRDIKAIKTMMHTAEDFKKIGIKQIWRLVKRDNSEVDGRIVWHTIDELRELKEIFEGDLLTVFFLGWEEGLRKSEIAFLYKSDYNPLTHTITVSKKREWSPKTKRSERTIPLRPDSEAAIIWSIANSPADCPYIISIPGDRHSSYYLSDLYRITVKFKLPHIKSFIHKLRHTFGSLLAQKGVPLKDICDLMGHTNTLQTEKYTHLGHTNYQNAIAKLPSI
ncbi:integrase [Elusimicrobium posterum]|uniref:tyrosine-type recombinase/integrase n=1 Tax=Elusimicrobium posterum TaxID=3116653 RepID=UPI003C74E4FC